ncbi:hypothetical protein B9Z65_9144 [Elsinoe australis]|uniref:Uncharacterized protein n=1 Tax=Elsinoe australis TaxID=40998 RepID=A0A2P8ABV3_9PEZI|nr:hypothetical protein B9Z65_9144 [Elsinoe australis]
MDNNCTVYAPYLDVEGRGELWATATWPGRSWFLDLGTKVQFAQETRGEWVATLPPNASYTYDDIITGTMNERQYTLPHLSIMYPNITDFRTCTRASFQTAPNSLKFAPFLTEIKTLPRTAEGSLTIPSLSRTADPGIRPTPNQPSPTQVGLPAPMPTNAPQPEQPGNNAGTNAPGSPPPDTPPNPARPDSQSSSPESPAQPGSGGASNSGSTPNQGSPVNQGNSQNQESSANQGSSPGQGNSPNRGSSPNQENPASPAQQANGASNQQGTKQTTVPALILPNAQTLREGSPPATVDGRLIFLDKGTIHVALTPTPGQAANAAQATALSLEQVTRQGGIEVGGTWMSLKSTTTVVSDAGSAGAGAGAAGTLSDSGSGALASSPAGGSAGDSVGKRISDLGTWIMSGLGASTGISGSGSGGSSSAQGSAEGSSQGGVAGTSQGGSGSSSTSGQNGGKGRNSTVVSFTGDAAHVGTGLSALAFFIGVAAWVL